MEVQYQYLAIPPLTGGLSEGQLEEKPLTSNQPGCLAASPSGAGTQDIDATTPPTPRKGQARGVK